MVDQTVEVERGRRPTDAMASEASSLPTGSRAATVEIWSGWSAHIGHHVSYERCALMPCALMPCAEHGAQMTALVPLPKWTARDGHGVFAGFQGAAALADGAQGGALYTGGVSALAVVIGLCQAGSLVLGLAVVRRLA